MIDFMADGLLRWFMTSRPVWHIDAVRGPSTQHCEPAKRVWQPSINKALRNLDCFAALANDSFLEAFVCLTHPDPFSPG